MRLRIALVFGLVAALALGAVGLTQAVSAFKITGGGQTEVGTTGAGDTIAFTARDTDADAGIAGQGQVQYIDREAGKVVGIYHGAVTCVSAVATPSDSEGAGFLAGPWTKSPDGTGTFEIYVQDNGEPNQGNDIVFLDRNSPPNCEDEEDDDGETALARGNAQVHNAP